MEKNQVKLEPKISVTANIDKEKVIYLRSYDWLKNINSQTAEKLKDINGFVL